MTDLVNLFFHTHYTDDYTATEPESLSSLGVMLRYTGRGGFKATIFPRMKCKDGFTMSVQGHWGAYSTPRDDFAENYSRVEVNCPSDVEPLLMPYVEDANHPTDTVYGYVPVEIVVEVVKKHGGLALSE